MTGPKYVLPPVEEVIERLAAGEHLNALVSLMESPEGREFQKTLQASDAFKNILSAQRTYGVSAQAIIHAVVAGAAAGLAEYSDGRKERINGRKH